MPIVTQSLESCPEYATELGHLVVASAHLEFVCLRLFGGVMQDYRPRTRALYYNTANFRGKMELIKRTARTTLTKKPADEVCELLDRIYKTYKKRNKYVHNVWAVIEEKAERRVILGDYDPAQANDSSKSQKITHDEVTIANLKSATDQLKKWSEDVHTLSVRLFGKPPF